MARPRFATAPQAAELAALECDEQRADAITAIADRLRTLPKGLADLRKQSLRALLAKGWTKTEIAERYGWHPSNVTHLTKSGVVAEEATS